MISAKHFKHPALQFILSLLLLPLTYSTSISLIGLNEPIHTLSECEDIFARGFFPNSHPSHITWHWNISSGLSPAVWETWCRNHRHTCDSSSLFIPSKDFHRFLKTLPFSRAHKFRLTLTTLLPSRTHSTVIGSRSVWIETTRNPRPSLRILSTKISPRQRNSRSFFIQVVDGKEKCEAINVQSILSVYYLTYHLIIANTTERVKPSIDSPMTFRIDIRLPSQSDIIKFNLHERGSSKIASSAFVSLPQVSQSPSANIPEMLVSDISSQLNFADDVKQTNWSYLQSDFFVIIVLVSIYVAFALGALFGPTKSDRPLVAEEHVIFSQWKDAYLEDSEVGKTLILLQDEISHISKFFWLWATRFCNEHIAFGVLFRDDGTNISTAERMLLLFTFVLGLCAMSAVTTTTDASKLGDLVLSVIISIGMLVIVLFVKTVLAKSRPSPEEMTDDLCNVLLHLNELTATDTTPPRRSTNRSITASPRSKQQLKAQRSPKNEKRSSQSREDAPLLFPSPVQEKPVQVSESSQNTPVAQTPSAESSTESQEKSSPHLPAIIELGKLKGGRSEASSTGSPIRTHSVDNIPEFKDTGDIDITDQPLPFAIVQPQEDGSNQIVMVIGSPKQMETVVVTDEQLKLELPDDRNARSKSVDNRKHPIREDQPQTHQALGFSIRISPPSEMDEKEKPKKIPKSGMPGGMAVPTLTGIPEFGVGGGGLPKLGGTKLGPGSASIVIHEDADMYFDEDEDKQAQPTDETKLMPGGRVPHPALFFRTERGLSLSSDRGRGLSISTTTTRAHSPSLSSHNYELLIQQLQFDPNYHWILDKNRPASLKPQLIDRKELVRVQARGNLIRQIHFVKKSHPDFSSKVSQVLRMEDGSETLFNIHPDSSLSFPEFTRTYSTLELETQTIIYQYVTEGRDNVTARVFHEFLEANPAPRDVTVKHDCSWFISLLMSVDMEEYLKEDELTKADLRNLFIEAEKPWIDTLWKVLDPDQQESLPVEEYLYLLEEIQLGMELLEEVDEIPVRDMSVDFYRRINVQEIFDDSVNHDNGALNEHGSRVLFAKMRHLQSYTEAPEHDVCITYFIGLTQVQIHFILEHCPARVWELITGRVWSNPPKQSQQPPPISDMDPLVITEDFDDFQYGTNTVEMEFGKGDHGFNVEIVQGDILVSKVDLNGVAYRQGVCVGWSIIAVDGKTDSEKIVELVNGPKAFEILFDAQTEMISNNFDDEDYVGINDLNIEVEDEDADLNVVDDLDEDDDDDGNRFGRSSSLKSPASAAFFAPVPTPPLKLTDSREVLPATSVSPQTWKREYTARSEQRMKTRLALVEFIREHNLSDIRLRVMRSQYAYPASFRYVCWVICLAGAALFTFLTLVYGSQLKDNPKKIGSQNGIFLNFPGKGSVHWLILVLVEFLIAVFVVHPIGMMVTTIISFWSYLRMRGPSVSLWKICQCMTDFCCCGICWKHCCGIGIQNEKSMTEHQKRDSMIIQARKPTGVAGDPSRMSLARQNIEKEKQRELELGSFSPVARDDNSDYSFDMDEREALDVYLYFATIDYFVDISDAKTYVENQLRSATASVDL